jgi:hypothetical protein
MVLAFAAGLVSFVSPCCLPLVPGSLATVSGSTPAEGARRVDPQVLARSGLFVLTFRSIATMRPRMSSRTPRSCLSCVALLGLLALAAAGCGSSANTPNGLTISGPGLQVSEPPWPSEYQHLAQRLHNGIPPGGKETFHIHAMLHIYVNGLLSPLPANIGLDSAKGLESSMHTHDSTGIIHMEAPHPFKYTLGDFFAVWGVKLGPAQVGGLTGYGGTHLHFYLNGKPLSNPAALVLHKGDSVVIGYGPVSSFPHTPSTFLLSEVEKGEGGLGCGAAKNGKKAHSCLAPKGTSTPRTAGKT